MNPEREIMDKRERTLIIGFGSEILTDDGIALKIIDELKLGEIDAVDFESVNLIGLENIELFTFYHRVILLDATTNIELKIGDVNHYLLDDFQESLHLVNFHDLSIHQLIEFARMLKMDVSDNIHVITIRVSEVEAFGYQLSEPLNNKYSDIYKEVLGKVKMILKQAVDTARREQVNNLHSPK